MGQEDTPDPRVFREFKASEVILGQKAIQVVKGLRVILDLRGRQDRRDQPALWGYKEILDFRDQGGFQDQPARLGRPARPEQMEQMARPGRLEQPEQLEQMERPGQLEQPEQMA